MALGEVELSCEVVDLLQKRGHNSCWVQATELVLYLSMDFESMDAAFLGENFESLVLVQRPRSGSFVDLLTPRNSAAPPQSYEELEGSAGVKEEQKLSDEGAYLQYLMDSDLDEQDLWGASMLSSECSSPVFPHTDLALQQYQSEPSSPLKLIGSLTLEERKAKIEKYQEKRRRRTWSKKVSYSCRKKVAENRLRVKGRFVTKAQALLNLLRVPELK